MRCALLFLLFISSCTILDIEKNIDQVDYYYKADLIHESEVSDYKTGNLFKHQVTGIVVKVACEINENLFKGLIVDDPNGELLCTVYAGSKDGFYLCLPCINLCQ